MKVDLVGQHFIFPGHLKFQFLSSILDSAHQPSQLTQYPPDSVQSRCSIDQMNIQSKAVHTYSPMGTQTPDSKEGHCFYSLFLKIPKENMKRCGICSWQFSWPQRHKRGIIFIEYIHHKLVSFVNLDKK